MADMQSVRRKDRRARFPGARRIAFDTRPRCGNLGKSRWMR
jgi:hypothetical protein